MKFDIKRPDWIDCIIVILIAIILAAGFLAISGCSFARKLDKTETKKDSISVSSIDSNWLKKIIEQNSATKASGQELRIYQPVPQQGSAAPVNNYFSTPGTDNSGLLAILTSWQHESQNQTKEAVDSGNMARKDSTAATLEASTKETDTKAGWDWKMVVMFALIALLIVERFFSRFKTPKNDNSRPA